jgi:uncharacterized protein
MRLWSIDTVPELRFLLRARDRHGQVVMASDGVSTLGHVVESLGIPLTEVGELRVNARPVEAGYRPAAGDQALVRAVRRPQPISHFRFCLDVHLGTLARRMRLLGLDTAYGNDRDDDELIEQANGQRRVLLTKDRLLLCRRRLWLGAYVQGDKADRQLADVLERFAPPLAPWTRCAACNGVLASVDKADIERYLLPGTRRCYEHFGQCLSCGRIYWPGAHHDRLQAIVDGAVSQARRDTPG